MNNQGVITENFQEKLHVNPHGADNHIQVDVNPQIGLKCFFLLLLNLAYYLGVSLIFQTREKAHYLRKHNTPLHCNIG